MYLYKLKKGLKNDIKLMCRKLFYISNIIKFIVDIIEVGMFMNYIFILCILYMYIQLVMFEYERFDLKMEFNFDLKNIIYWSLIKFFMYIIFFDVNCIYIVYVQFIYSYIYIYNIS